ncbi:MAG: replication-relaxation family protein [Aeromicrobium sp.]
MCGVVESWSEAMNAYMAIDLDEHLSTRDVAILTDLERFRLLDTKHVQRLHYTDHTSDLAAARACNRALLRLRELGLISSLDRRVGGVRKGSASFVWQLAATGERFLRATRGQAHRRRFMEPGPYFVTHTLAVNDVAVGLLEAPKATPGFAVEELVTEPSNWRSYLGANGETRWLKPDLYVVTHHAGGDEGRDGYEEHTFLEVDLGTEHLPRIQAKCLMYAAYANTGAYQAEHALFPVVVWLSPDPARSRALEAAISATRNLPQELFRVTSPKEYLTEIASAE